MAADASGLQRAIWNGSLPLEIRLAHADSRVFDKADPYMVHVPRVSYLPFLLPRLHAFFQPALIDPDIPLHSAWFSFDGVPLRWYHPVGLLYDLFSGPESASKRENDDHQHKHPHQQQPEQRQPAIPTQDEQVLLLPWKLVIHFSGYPYDQLAQIDAEGKAVHDAFINTVKEADFLRYGSAKGIMALSKDDSTRFWRAVQEHDLEAFNRVNRILMPGDGGKTLKHVPVRFYLPASPKAEQQQAGDGSSGTGSGNSAGATGHLKIVQSLVAPTLGATGRVQTMGTALNAVLPSLFPSKSTPILAKAVLHGAVVPMAANLEELLRSCAYLDGWLHVSIEMMG